MPVAVSLPVTTVLDSIDETVSTLAVMSFEEMDEDDINPSTCDDPVVIFSAVRTAVLNSRLVILLLVNKPAVTAGEDKEENMTASLAYNVDAVIVPAVKLCVVNDDTVAVLSVIRVLEKIFTALIPVVDIEEELTLLQVIAAVLKSLVLSEEATRRDACMAVAVMLLAVTAPLISASILTCRELVVKSLATFTSVAFKLCIFAARTAILSLFSSAVVMFVAVRR